MLSLRKCLFVIFLFFNGYLVFSHNQKVDYTFILKQADSLFELHKNPEILKTTATKIINLYKPVVSNKDSLSDTDLKKLAVSYAYLNDTVNSLAYLERYVKQSHNIDFIEDDTFDKFNNHVAYIEIEDKYLPQYNFWFFFYCYIGFIGIFLAILLNFKKTSDRLANLLISLFLLFGSLFILHVCIFITNVMFLMPHSAHATITFNFLYGPLLYFYFKRITSKYKFKFRDALHLMPFVFFAIYFSRYYVLSPDEKLHLLFNRFETKDPIMPILVALKIISLLAYGILIYRMYIKEKNYTLQSSIVINWKRNIATLNLAYVFSHIFYLAIIILFVSLNYLIHLQLVSMSTFILFVGYTAYVQPEVFKKKDQLPLKNGVPIDKYKNSALTENLSLELRSTLLDLLHKEKLYKQNNLNLELLSEKLGTNRHGASQVINEHFNMNFFNLINKYRIKEAKEIFNQDYHCNLTIIEVAYTVGFNNKVTFNKAFKEETGMTPTQYIKGLKKQTLPNYRVNKP